MEHVSAKSSADLKPQGIKAPLGLLPLRGLAGIAAAMEFGSKKYLPFNWQDTYPDESEYAIRQTYGGAALRHILAWTDPSEDDIDPESGVHHLFHAGACVLIAIWRLGLGYAKPNDPKSEH
jgi:hypothetical protein